MSETSGHTHDHDLDHDSDWRSRRLTTETKASFKTTELIAFVAAVIGVLVASQRSDDFGAVDAWRFVTYLTIGYMIARGLAKAGSSQPYDE